MNTGNRPLSPHLQVYRWEWTMLLSITHRATGIALAVGALLLTVSYAVYREYRTDNPEELAGADD